MYLLLKKKKILGSLCNNGIFSTAATKEWADCALWKLTTNSAKQIKSLTKVHTEIPQIQSLGYNHKSLLILFTHF